MFQSSPGLVTGRYASGLAVSWALLQFQSSPGLVTGRYRANRNIKPVAVVVSILARSGDRALLRTDYQDKWQREFQSSPGLVTGRYVGFQKQSCQQYMFQSSPGLVTGRYALWLG